METLREPGLSLLRLAIPLFIAVTAYLKHWLTFGGSVTGALFGGVTVLVGGSQAAALLGFFMLGTLATKLSKQFQQRRVEQQNNSLETVNGKTDASTKKNGSRSKEGKDKYVVISYDNQAVHGEEKRGRTSAQVFATAGIPTVLCFFLLFADSFGVTDDQQSVLSSLFFSYFACSCADTFASEIGVLSKRRPLLLSTLQPVPRGTDGAISLEGTLASLLGGAVIGLTAAADSTVNSGLAFSVMKYALVGFFGSLFDSGFGCFLQTTEAMAKDPKVIIPSSFHSVSLMPLLVALEKPQQFGELPVWTRNYWSGPDLSEFPS